MRDPHDRVGARERQRVVVERARHGERGHDHRRHCGEDHDPHGALLGIDDAREPRVARPRPPEHREDEEPAYEASPVGVVGHQSRALGDRKHEDEVEEELERRHPLFLAPCRRHPVVAL